MIELTEEQKYVHDNLLEWIEQYHAGKHSMDFINVGGFAGSGKTTLLGELTKSIHSLGLAHSISFCTFTGKASIVLKRKIIPFMQSDDTCSTIHSLIYKPILNPITLDIEGWYKKDYDEIGSDLIIIDEASMVNLDLWKDLISYEIPIIAIGDHAQLPPIGNDNFNLMNDPFFKLEQIHRQAENSPIIKLSMIARNEGVIKEGIYGNGVACLDWGNSICQNAMNTVTNSNDSQIICGLNKTRVKLNKKIRRIIGFNEPIPVESEKIICLKNNKNNHIMNGQIGFIKHNIHVHEKCFKMTINMDGEDLHITSIVPFEIFNLANQSNIYDLLKDPDIKITKANEKCEIDFFDYAYAISCHKSQGSEWKKAIVIEEYNMYQSESDMARWLYTAITRASEKLLIIRDFY